MFLFCGEYLLDVKGRASDIEVWTPENGVLSTILFHVFVFMQVFNEINCRKLKEDEFNVFKDFFNNGLFLFVIILTIIVQIVLVEYGGEAVKCSPLTLNQHLMCIGIGACSLITGLLVRLLPISMFNLFKVNEVPLETDDEIKEAYGHAWRKSRSIYRMRTQSKLNLVSDAGTDKQKLMRTKTIGF